MKWRMFEDLYNDYFKERTITLSESEFAALLTMFPALLVVNADNVIETSEWKHVEELALEIAMSECEVDEETDEAHSLARVFIDEIRFLKKHLGQYEDRFLETLAHQLDVNSEFKAIIKEMLDEAAKSSGQTEPEEVEKIKEILAKLHIN